MRKRALLAAVLLAGCLAAAGHAPAAATEQAKAGDRITPERVCRLLSEHAGRYGLSADFLARLIWKESRFDPDAVSPVGAEGIAQFMPGTARLRGLADPFDIDQAIPASAEYLAELKRTYGNLGLAAAAYNAGENRVSRWLAKGGFLPLETEDYVNDIMGESVDAFSDAAYAGTIRPLDPEKPFLEACSALPVTHASVVAMARVPRKPWGVQVAGNIRRAAALRQWARVRARFPRLLGQHRPAVSRVRSARVPRGIYAVRIGADSRAEAEKVCRTLRGAGGACVVLRNR